MADSRAAPAPHHAHDTSASASASAAAPGQRGSYIYVSHASFSPSASPSSSLDGDERPRRVRARAVGVGAEQPPAAAPARPRFFLLLPLLATLDLASCVALAAAVLDALRSASGGDGHGDGDGDEESRKARETTRRLIGALVGVAAIRTVGLVGLGVRRGVREHAIAVAGLCLLSVLALVSIANILFLLPSSPSPLSSLSPSYLLLHQLALILLEWAAYIAVIGVPLPPGRVSALRARRWQRGVRREGEAWRGEEDSLYDAGDEGEEAAPASPEEQAHEEGLLSSDDEEARAARLEDIRPHALRNDAHSTPESDAEEDIAAFPAAGGADERSTLLRTPTLPRSTTLPNVSSPLSPSQLQAQQQQQLSPGPGASRLRTRASYGALRSGESMTGNPTSANRRSTYANSPRVSLYAGDRDVEAQRRFPAGASGDESVEELDPDELVDAPLDRASAREHSRRRLESAKLRGDAERERRGSLIAPLAFAAGQQQHQEPTSPSRAPTTSPRLGLAAAAGTAPSTPAPPRRSSSAAGAGPPRTPLSSSASAAAAASPASPAPPSSASTAATGQGARRKLKLRLWSKKLRGGGGAGRESTESPPPQPGAPSTSSPAVRGGSAPPPASAR